MVSLRPRRDHTANRTALLMCPHSWMNRGPLRSDKLESWMIESRPFMKSPLRSWKCSLTTIECSVPCLIADFTWVSDKLGWTRIFLFWKVALPKLLQPVDIPCHRLSGAVDQRLIKLSLCISYSTRWPCLGQEPRRAMISEPGFLSPGEETCSSDVRKQKKNQPSPRPAASKIKGGKKICVHLVQLAPIKANN